MRLLQVNSVYGYGSTGRIVKDIHQAALEKGIDSLVAYGRGQHDDKRLIKIGSKKDLVYHGLKTRFFDQHGLASKNATRKFVDQINELKPDIIHLHNIHGYYLNYPILFDYLKSIDIKVIWTMHDCWAYTGHCSYYSFVECNKWENHCDKCPQLNKYPKSLGIDNSYHNYELKRNAFLGLSNLTIITPSRWLSEELKKSFLKQYVVKIINNGIDLSIFRPLKSDFKKRNGLVDKKIILGIASVWDERKGLNFFMKLAKLLNDDEAIVLVGAKKSKSLNEMVVIERTNNAEELTEIYSAADVLLNPTLEDNYPTVNLESIACGTPVIVNNIGGSEETIIDNFGQLMIEYDPMATIQQIRKLFKNKGTLSKTFKNIQLNAMSIENMVQNYVDVYHSVQP